MSDNSNATPYRASTPTAPSAPTKRWYFVGDLVSRDVGLVGVAVLFVLWLFCAAVMFIVWDASGWRTMLRALIVVALFALAWCACFVRYGARP